MTLTNEQLKKIYPNSTEKNRQKYLSYLNYYAVIYEVNTFERWCAFLAQIGHESGQLLYVEELASGEAYEGRKNLGNTQKGDGKRYKGRGLIQVTGRANYQRLTDEMRGLAMGVDFVEQPELLKEPEYAVQSAFWYWNDRNLNKYADLNEDNFKKITKIINGGYNGYADRVAIWNRAKEVLR